MGKSELEDFKAKVAEYLGEDVDVTLFWKGRIALYAILKSLGMKEGDEVIVPGFTCVVVPNAVIYTNAKPIYADIDRRTYTITRDTVEPLIGPRTKAIVIQNTFGLSAEVDAITELAEKYDVDVIDDCAHGFGGRYKGRPNGVSTRASFFSTQWNKPFSTGIGGLAVTTDKALAGNLRKFEARAIEPKAREVLMLRLMHSARRMLVGKQTYWRMLELYRWLSSKGLVIGSSDAEELSGPEVPSELLKRMSPWQAQTGSRALESLGQAKEFRKRVAEEYDQLLTDLGKTVPARPDYAEHAFLKYPVRVRDRDVFMQRARESRVRMGDWFLSPLHPVQHDLSIWHYQKGACPVSEEATEQMINLPTDFDMSTGEIEGVKEFVVRNKHYLL